jgi:hypothetical protein
MPATLSIVPAALYKHMLTHTRAPIELLLRTTGQGARCMLATARETDRSIEYGRSKQHARRSGRRARAHGDEGRASGIAVVRACPRPARSFAPLRLPRESATRGWGKRRDAGGGGVIMVFPRGRSGAMAPAPATWRTYACWTGLECGGAPPQPSVSIATHACKVRCTAGKGSPARPTSTDWLSRAGPHLQPSDGHG